MPATGWSRSAWSTVPTIRRARFLTALSAPPKTRPPCVQTPSPRALDDPAVGLNPHESAELGNYLHAIRDEHAISILLIEHDMSVVMRISDHIVVLDHGQRIADGTAQEIRHDPKVIAAYLGVEEVP